MLETYRSFREHYIATQAWNRKVRKEKAFCIGTNTSVDFRWFYTDVSMVMYKSEWDDRWCFQNPKGTLSESLQRVIRTHLLNHLDHSCRKLKRTFLKSIPGAGKKDYDARLDKKQCPSCTAVQAYDEFAEKRNLCVECAVEYVRPNLGGAFSQSLVRESAYERFRTRDSVRDSS